MIFNYHVETWLAGELITEGRPTTKLGAEAQAAYLRIKHADTLLDFKVVQSDNLACITESKDIN